MTRIIVLSVMLSLLTACARQPVYQAANSPAWEAHRRMMDTITDWKIEGRVGLYSDNEAWPGDLLWQQTDNSYDIRLIAPVAAGNMHIYSVSGGVMFEHSGDSQVHFTASPEALIQQTFGWQMPITDLRYWIKGIPSPDSRIQGVINVDEHGRLTEMVQSGWKVSYQKYSTQAGKMMPKKILLEQADLSIKIFIRNWQLM